MSNQDQKTPVIGTRSRRPRPADDIEVNELKANDDKAIKRFKVDQNASDHGETEQTEMSQPQQVEEKPDMADY